jgi:hypothetical protein
MIRAPQAPGRELTPQEKADQIRLRRALAAGEVVLDLPWAPRPFDGIRPEDAGL